ncbi:MAG: hypothetical protein K0R82_2356 [Flavipsychrobacter sp.]|jgi:pimeloyl-ACP methyl ester carboxylesterase|nr:hypothetical protein [Flavipsychrobacter sp.]
MAPNNYKTRKLQLSNDSTVAYIDEGQGTHTLLFIHGLGTYALSWRYNVDYLKQYFRCIALDLPGNGFSDRGEYPYGISFFSASVLEFIQKLQLTNVVLVGHSMGGQVVLDLAIKHTDCAAKLVLCAPAGFETFTAFERSTYMSALRVADLFSSAEDSIASSVLMGFYHQQPEAVRIVNELKELLKGYPGKEYRKMIDGCIYGMLHEPVVDRLHLIKQKTLVLFGEHDALIPNRLIHFTSTENIAVSGSSKIPKAKLEMVPGAGHFVQIEKAELVNRMIHQFVLEG